MGMGLCPTRASRAREPRYKVTNSRNAINCVGNIDYYERTNNINILRINILYSLHSLTTTFFVVATARC